MKKNNKTQPEQEDIFLYIERNSSILPICYKYLTPTNAKEYVGRIYSFGEEIQIGYGLFYKPTSDCLYEEE